MMKHTQNHVFHDLPASWTSQAQQQAQQQGRGGAGAAVMLASARGRSSWTSSRAWRRCSQRARSARASQTTGSATTTR